MRQGGQILSRVFQIIKKEIKIGVTTKHLDQVARKQIEKFRVKSSFLGYRGYPAALCCSVNDEVVHGIPSDRKLISGDIIGLDLGIKYQGWHVDRAETFAVGKINPIKQKLIKVTKEALEQGISEAKEGNYVRDIARAIQKVAEEAGFSVIRDCTGHGVGREVHEEPTIPNYDTGFSGPRLEVGMTLAIEPMICEKDYRIKTKLDNWTIATIDQGNSAHFEETVLVTRKGPEILTK